MLRNKIAVVSASLGGFDKDLKHVPQSVEYDYFIYTDENFPPRINSMTPRLQAKIPKCFAWQLAPDYNYYLWLDGNITLASADAVKFFYDNCQGYDLVVLQHPRRTNVHWEGRYVWRGLKEGSRYMAGRYANEWIDEQMAEIEGDRDFVDDTLVNGGVFMYKNTPMVRQMLKQWWYHISRYLIMDQCSFAYVIKKSGIKVNVRPEVFNDCPYLAHHRHAHHY